MFEFEIYNENNKKMVYLSNDGSSGCKYSFNNKEELKQIVANYIDDNYNEDAFVEKTDSPKNEHFSLTYFDKVGSRVHTDNFTSRQEALKFFNNLVESYEENGTSNSSLELRDDSTDKIIAEWENPGDIDEDADDDYDDDDDCDCDEEYEEVDLDVAEKIAKDYGVVVDVIAGLSLRDIEQELGEEEGALDRYLLDEDDETDEDENLSTYFVMWWNDRKDEPVVVYEVLVASESEAIDVAYEAGGKEYDDEYPMISTTDLSESRIKEYKNSSIIGYEKISKKPLIK